jgi:DNA-binding transcriptional regulator YhcF (GntR family)
MDIRIAKDSDVPLHEQVAAQLVLLIGTGALKVGTLLPSVRALALRLGVHRNTISRAYHDVTLNLLVEKRTGARLVVLTSEPETSPGARNLDALLAATIAEARRRGYSLREVHDRLLSRLLVAPPDRLLVITDEIGMRTLLTRELAERLKCRTDVCTPADLRSAPQRALGAVVVSQPGYVRGMRALLAPGHPLVAITYTQAEPHLKTIRELHQPSLIAVISVSGYFIEMARAVLAPAIGRRHSLQSHLVTGKRLEIPRAADVIVCDSLTYPIVLSRCKAPIVIAYRLIAESCLDKVSAAIHGQGSTRKRK